MSRAPSVQPNLSAAGHRSFPSRWYAAHRKCGEVWFTAYDVVTRSASPFDLLCRKLHAKWRAATPHILCRRESAIAALAPADLLPIMNKPSCFGFVQRASERGDAMAGADAIPNTTVGSAPISRHGVRRPPLTLPEPSSSSVHRRHPRRAQRVIPTRPACAASLLSCDGLITRRTSGYWRHSAFRCLTRSAFSAVHGEIMN